MDYKRNTSQRYPTFFSEEDIEGTIELKLKKQNFEHNGIRAELHGVVEKYNKINSTITEFTNLGIEILRPGVIQEVSSVIPFSFKNTKLQYESYKGVYAQVKYFIKIIINANVRTYTYEQEFAAVNPNDDGILMENDDSIKLPLGIQNLLSLDFEVEHNNYNCRGIIKGFVSFNYIHLPIKYMELQLLKKEKIFMDNKREDPDLIESVELIDGSVTKNDVIPFRLFLKSYNLTPTYRNVHNIFSLKYYINLVIGDFNGNTFFKQAEIRLFRLFKTKINPELNYGPWEEFIGEPIYNEEYYHENKNKENNNGDKDNNNNKDNKKIDIKDLFNDIEGNEEEEYEEEEDESEEDDDDNDNEEKLEDDNLNDDNDNDNDNEFIISTSTTENKKKEKSKNKNKKKKKKNKNIGIVSILRSNSLYKNDKVNNNINSNVINNNDLNIQNNNEKIISFGDDDENNDIYMNKVIYSNFPNNSNNNLFNEDNNNEINTDSNYEINTSSNDNFKYSKYAKIKFDY